MNLKEELINQFQNNQIFSGLAFASVIASVLGSLLYTLRDLPKLLLRLMAHSLLVSMRVDNSDPAFYEIEKWMSLQSFSKKSRRLSLSSTKLREEDDDNIGGIMSGRHSGSSTGGKKSNWVLSPGLGRHFFIYHRRLFCVERDIDTGKAGTGTTATSVKKGLMEHFNITTYGRSQEPVRALVDATCAFNQSDTIYIYSWTDWWRMASTKLKRNLDTVIIPEEKKQALVNDINWFLTSKTWYSERGVPYHRGYLFTGPPGTGKTSLITGIASKLDLPIYALNLSVVKDDSGLMEAFSLMPRNAIALIEDIDACAISADRVKKRSVSDEDGGGPGVTLSGLLNVIDGVTTSDGRILFMTTNHMDKLDPALIRPGRIDMTVELGLAEPEELYRLFLLFYPGCDILANEFSVCTGGISPAEVQKIFMKHADDPRGVIEEVRREA